MVSSIFLWLCRSFDERVVGTANHVAERGASGHHGINGIFLLNAEVHENGFLSFASGANGGNHIGARSDTFASNAKSVGQSGEIRRNKRSSNVALVVEEFLPLANHAEIAVVNDGDLDVDLFLNDGGKLAHGHLEAAVAHDDPDFGIGLGELRSDGSGKCKAHGAEAAGSDERSGLIVVVILRFPHLVLADVGDNDGLAAGFFPNVVNDVRGVEMAVVGQALNVANGGITFQLLDVANPISMAVGVDMRRDSLKNLTRIANKRCIDFHVLVDFCAVDFNVNLACIARISAKITSHAIIKAHTNSNKQVGFLNSVVNPNFAVHTHHAEVKRIGGREAADAEQRHGDGIIAGAHKLFKCAHRARNHNTVASKNNRALRVVEQFDSAIKFSLIKTGALALRRKLRRGSLPIKLGSCLLSIRGNVDENGTRPAGIRNRERLAHAPRNVLRTRHNDVVLRNRHRNTGDVDLLKRIGAEHLAAHLPGNAHNGRRIEHGSCDAGDHVGRARTGSSHGHANAATGARIAIGHMRRALLVTYENVVKLGFSERVVYRKNRASGISKNMFNAEFSQRFTEDFCTG